MMDQKKHIVVIGMYWSSLQNHKDREVDIQPGGGIIGSTTAYYLTRHTKFNPSLHTITLLEASSIAAGASGKAGGLLALWAYPECLVPLSYRLHQELAEQHGGAEKWGYRRVGCGSIGAAVTKDDLGAHKAAKDIAQAKASSPQPGMSALQTDQGSQSVPPSSSSAPGIAQPEEASQPTSLRPGEVNDYANGAAVAPPPLSIAAPMLTSAKTSGEAVTNGYLAATSSMDDKGKAVGRSEVEGTTAKSERNDKEWEKLPKQDAAAVSLLKDSPLPADLDWIDRNLVHHYEEMGRHGFTETSQVHPFHFTTAIAELARSAGVDIRLGAKVVNIHNVSAECKTVEYEDRTRDNAARSMTGVTDVIVTAGPWTGKLLPRSKVEGLRAHSVVYEADVSPYAVFTDIQLPGDYIPEHRKRLGQRRKHRGNVDPEVYARPFGEVYACGESVQKQHHPAPLSFPACALSHLSPHPPSQHRPAPRF